MTNLYNRACEEVKTLKVRYLDLARKLAEIRAKRRSSTNLTLCLTMSKTISKVECLNFCRAVSNSSVMFLTNGSLRRKKPPNAELITSGLITCRRREKPAQWIISRLTAYQAWSMMIPQKLFWSSGGYQYDRQLCRRLLFWAVDTLRFSTRMVHQDTSTNR